MEKDTNNISYLKIPLKFICPITEKLIKNPVKIISGYVYEKEAIELWFSRGNRKDPLTSKELLSTEYSNDENLRKEILEFISNMSNYQLEFESNVNIEKAVKKREEELNKKIEIQKFANYTKFNYKSSKEIKEKINDKTLFRERLEIRLEEGTTTLSIGGSFTSSLDQGELCYTCCDCKCKHKAKNLQDLIKASIFSSKQDTEDDKGEKLFKKESNSIVLEKEFIGEEEDKEPKYLKGSSYYINSRETVNQKDEKGRTAVHIAVIHKATDILETLITGGARINEADLVGRWTPLHHAIWHESETAAKVLIRHGAYLNVKDKKGWTPLHMAAKKSSKELVELLVKKGSNLNDTNSVDWTPLHVACKNNRNDITEFLLTKQVDIEAKTSAGYTPLHFAIINKNLEMINLLIKNGSILRKKDNCGWNSLHLAVNTNTKEVVDLILSKSLICVNEKNIYQETPLHLATKLNNYELVKLLIQKGARINDKDVNGKTPLHIAADKCSKEIVQFLVDKKANIIEKDNFDWTPFDYAKDRKSNSIKLLK